MMHRVHEALMDTVGARPEHVRIVVHEVPRTHWSTGDVTLREMDEHNSPPDVVPDVAPDTQEEEQS
jgi:4-oxalocrotonate tautomerase